MLIATVRKQMCNLYFSTLLNHHPLAPLCDSRKKQQKQSPNCPPFSLALLRRLMKQKSASAHSLRVTVGVKQLFCMGLQRLDTAKTLSERPSSVSYRVSLATHFERLHRASRLQVSQLSSTAATHS